MTPQQMTNQQKLLFNKYKVIRSLIFIIYVFQVAICLSVFDTKLLANYEDHHFTFLFSATSSFYVVLTIILHFIGYSIRYKIYTLTVNATKQIIGHTEKMTSSRRVLEHKKLTTECRRGNFLIHSYYARQGTH